MSLRKYSFLVLLFLLVAVTAMAGDIPGAVRVATGNNIFIAGIQLTPGTHGDFELFSGQTGQQAIHPLGRYNGRLVGVAVDASGETLALTKDGSLNSYGDEPQVFAVPDSRWDMQALAVWKGELVAVTFDNGELLLARPDKEQSWVTDPVAIAATEAPARTELVVLPDSLHVFWTTRSDPLSGGDIRHASLNEAGLWKELEPLILGNAVGFCVYADGNDLHLTALAADPLGAAPRHPVSRIWRNGNWRTTELSQETRDILKSDSFSFAAAVAEKQTLWLATSPDGAVLSRMTAQGEVSRSALAPPPDGVDIGLAPRFTSLVTVLMICGLLLLYCRRSRTLSRLYPQRPPDLLSRGAALGMDWMMATFAMGAYHWTSGDMRILPDLLRIGRVEFIFWGNLAGMALFMFIAEAAFGTTPGKHLAGLRVASVFGGRPSPLQAGVRNLLRVVDMYPLSGAFPGLIGAVAVFLNRGRQRIGDILAGTVVRRHLPLNKRGILLASASPRRLDLVRELGVNVRVEVPDVDESAIHGDSPFQTVRRLAEAKAMSMKEKARPPEVVVAADTIVVIDGDILGKPADAAEAAAMLKRLSGRSHSVFTGVAVWDPASGRALVDVEETEVEFRALSSQEIDAYVATGDPLDKAGAYGIQSGYVVKQVRGSLSNVAGLPMEKLQSMLGHLTL